MSASMAQEPLGIIVVDPSWGCGENGADRRAELRCGDFCEVNELDRRGRTNATTIVPLACRPAAVFDNLKRPLDLVTQLKSMQEPLSRAAARWIDGRPRRPS